MIIFVLVVADFKEVIYAADIYQPLNINTHTVIYQPDLPGSLGLSLQWKHGRGNDLLTHHRNPPLSVVTLHEGVWDSAFKI